MHLPTLDGFPHRDVPRGRIYRVDASTELAAFHVEHQLPGVGPVGFIVYAFVRDDAVVGEWDWTDTPAGLEAVARAFSIATNPNYEPPQHRAPGGEGAQIRPPIQNLVARAREAARPHSGVDSRLPPKPALRIDRSDEG